MASEEIQKSLEISGLDAERIVRLLERQWSIAHEIEHLEMQGIFAITKFDPKYPLRYGERLRELAPIFLYYSGEVALLGQPGIAVVGSRQVDQTGQDCALFVGNTCGLSGLVLYSGCAKGVDSLSMMAALDARGCAVGVLADSLAKKIKERELRNALNAGNLCLATPYAPDAGFSVGSAMGRNRLIYCLADYAVVVASDAEKGGTWAGATEALKNGWLPVFILEHSRMPDGNRLLIEKGGIPFPHPFPEHYRELESWLRDHSPMKRPNPTQMSLL